MNAEMMKQAKFRAVLRSNKDGSEFPIYLGAESEAADAAKFLQATVVSVVPAGPADYIIDMVNALDTGTNIINK